MNRTTRKVVINVRYGGFGLSEVAEAEYCRRSGLLPESFSNSDIERDDSLLVSIVESMGDAANGPYAQLKVVRIPSDIQWHIEECDGLEWIAENHRTWR